MNYNNFQNFSTKRISWLISYLWGLAEGLVFFIIPDVYIAFIALFSISGGLYAILFSVLGSLTAGIIMFLIVSRVDDNINTFLDKIPAISNSMIYQVSENLSNKGLIEMVTAPLNGIPYKIYAAQAALNESSLFEFLFWTVPARLLRILPVTIVALVVSFLLKKYIKKYTTFFVFSYLIVWVIIYIFYFTNIK